MAQQIAVGQEVAIQNGYGRGHVNFGFTVAKVTRSGQVVIDVSRDGIKRERRFDADGYEMGASHLSSSKYNRDRLVVDVAAAREQAARDERSAKAAGLLNEAKAEHVRDTWGKDSMLKIVADLEAKLAAARAAVEAI